MYINISILFDGILIILGIVALVVLILCLLKLFKILSKLNLFLDENKNKLNRTVSNIDEISENVKGISDVATEATADAIVMKDNLTDQLTTLKDIFGILLSIFQKK